MKYIAFYDTEDYKYENRSVAPAAADVVRYMADVLSDIEPVEIICPARTLNESGYYQQRTIKLSDKINLTLPSTFGAKTKIGRIFSVIWNQLWLFFYLLFHLNRNEKIIVYHSLAYMSIISMIKKIKKLQLILEVREIYSDVLDSYTGLKNASKKLRQKENSFFSIADKYIFPTKLLNQKINKNNKMYVIATGIYLPSEIIVNSKWIEKIHVVYAGTLSKEKGSNVAIEVAQYLPSNYHIHILGYGTEQEITEIRELIEATKKTCDACLSYDGLLRGNDFKQFLQKCRIGLVTQDISCSFNETSFPSKVLMYLTNGLEVIAGRIPAIEQSGVGNIVNYYDQQSSESIAKTIMSINLLEPKNKREVLISLDKKLKIDIRNILNN